MAKYRFRDTRRIGGPEGLGIINTKSPFSLRGAPPLDFEFRVQITGLDGIIAPGGLLDPKIYKKALVRATNKIAKQAQVAAAKEIRRIYKMPLSSKEIKAAIRIFSANEQNSTAQLWVSSKRRIATGASIPLIKYGAKQIKSGVSFKIKKTGGRKKINRRFYRDNEERVSRRVLAGKDQWWRVTRIFNRPWQGGKQKTLSIKFWACPTLSN